jgi:hypothetical protein
LVVIGFVAKTKSKVRDRAYSTIVYSPFIAYAAESRVTVGDANTEAKIIT